jgi:hypothetical protein
MRIKIERKIKSVLYTLETILTFIFSQNTSVGSGALSIKNLAS